MVYVPPNSCHALVATRVDDLPAAPADDFQRGLRGRELPPSPDVVYGPLFDDVQCSRIFPDQKTFCDVVPRQPPADILREFAAARASGNGAVDLRRFVAAHFLVPETPVVVVPGPESLEAHLRTLWRLLRRSPDHAASGSSLLPLPHPYVVPGGRFREVYYWDSYFTMLGLRECGDEVMIHDMVDNVAYLIDTYGFVPNGNRTYYLGRSQPPFFALMVELIAEHDGAAVYQRYLPALRAEYAYWTDASLPTRHAATLPDGASLARYYDRDDSPRPEAWALDEALAKRSTETPATLYRNVRSAAESGWDFSTRWFADGRSIETIHTTELAPVDLNCLLYQLERTLAHAYPEASDQAASDRLSAAAELRRRAILQYCWSAPNGFFFDYDLRRHRRSEAYTLAGVVPLFLGVATSEQAKQVGETVRGKFLRRGGVVTTLVSSGQQWDAPNGWAPLEWMTIAGLTRYGQTELAAEIARRWIAVNTRVYRATGRMMEKYDVEDLSKPSGGGEYPTQDGFGWTNGVLLKLLHEFPTAKPR